MGKPHTIIGAERFHFRVRDGIGWDPNAIVAGRTGVLLCWPTEGLTEQQIWGVVSSTDQSLDWYVALVLGGKAIKCITQSKSKTAWVLYGQASRAISTS